MRQVPATPSIMTPELRNQEPILGRAANQAVLSVDTSRPPAGQCPAQRFRLSGPGERCPRAFPDQLVDTRQQFPVRPLPMEVVFPRTLVKDEPHSSRSRSVPLPL